MKSQKRSAPAQQMQFVVRPLASACLLAIAASAMPAFAQQTPATPQQVETTVVTGIRKGIEDAISLKKNADNIVEAISAEDIGKLPDTTVAESISRLPGVSAQRDKSTGKAQAVSVRGLSQDFTGGLLNGREQASTGDSRGVNLDQYPAELLGGVLLYKTPDASLIGQGLAGTIDNRTVRPLNFAGRTASASYRRVSTSHGAGEGTSTGDGDRISLTYIDQFADRTIGLALGFTRLEEKGGQQQKFNNWGGWTPDDQAKDPAGKFVKAIGGFTSDTEQLNQKRDGALAVLQFKPSKNFELTADIFFSRGETSLKKTGLEGAIAGSAGPYDPNAVVTNATITNGLVSTGTFSNYRGVVRNHLEAGNDDLLSIGVNGKFRLGEWLANADLSQSKVTRDSVRYETTAGLAGNVTTLDSITYSGFNGSNNTSVVYKTGLNYADRNAVKLTDVNGWSGGPDSPQAGYLAAPKVEDTINSVRFSLGRDVAFGPISRAEFGVNLADREKNRSTEEGRLIIKGQGPYGTVTVPGTETAIAGITGIPIVSFDPRGTLGTIYEQVQKVDTEIFNKSWSVNEKMTTLYVKGDLDGSLGGYTYRGNVGIQYVGAKQESSAFNVSATTCTGNTVATCPTSLISGGKSVTDFLPSLNIGFDIGADQIVRLALAQTMSRPNMADLRSSTTFSFDQTKGVYAGSGGNPNLDPFRAKAFDISYEKYFGKKGYISVAGFYKDLDSYILKVGRPFDFKANLGNATALGSTLGILTVPFNGSAGTIRGVEFAINVPFSLFHRSLDGFGVLFNHSDTSSSISLASAGFNVNDVGVDNIPLPGLSKRVSNLRVYYENYGFQFAVAARQRSNFLGEISDFQDNRQLSFVKAETTVDVQAAYDFSAGMLKGLGIYAQGSNLTNQKFQRYNSTPDKIIETITYGKTFTAGLSYKF